MLVDGLSYWVGPSITAKPLRDVENPRVQSGCERNWYGTMMWVGGRQRMVERKTCRGSQFQDNLAFSIRLEDGRGPRAVFTFLSWPMRSIACVGTRSFQRRHSPQKTHCGRALHMPLHRHLRRLCFRSGAVAALHACIQAFLSCLLSSHALYIAHSYGILSVHCVQHFMDFVELWLLTGRKPCWSSSSSPN